MSMGRQVIRTRIISLKIAAWLTTFLFVISILGLTSIEASGEAVGLGNQAEVVWPERHKGSFNIYYSRLTVDGWTAKIPLSESNVTDVMPCLCSGSNGVSWAVWTADSGQKSELFYAYSEQGGWTEPEKINTGLLFNTAPSIVVDKRNGPWIVWAGSNGEGSDIFFSRWNGRDWDQASRVNKTDSTPDTLPLIGIDGDGIPWVCWFGFDGTRYRPYSSKWSSEGWGDEIESDSDNLYEVLIEMGEGGAIPGLPEFVTVPERASVYVPSKGQLNSIPIRYLTLGNLLRPAPLSGPDVMGERQSPGGLVLLCFGDSITQGFPTIKTVGDGRRVGGYEPQLELLLNADSRPTQAFNWGVGGEWTLLGIDRIDSVLSNPYADYILILEGTNDYWHAISYTDTVINLGIMIDKSLAQGVTPILSTLTPDTASPEKQIPTTYNPAIMDLAAEKGVTLADQYEALIANWELLFTDDGLHPNDLGYNEMAYTWFITLPEGPDVTTGEATSIGFTTAQLNGTINPNGSATTYYFEYGTTTAYGISTSSASAGSGTGPTAVNASVTDLINQSLYHYRLVAVNSGGTVYGSDRTFTADGCQGDVVVLENVTFVSGTDCECIAGTSITIGTGVTIESGAHVTFTAPSVIIGSGFNAQNGSTVEITVP